MNGRVLFVDDEPNVLDAFRRALRKSFEVTTCVNPQEALQMVRTEPDFAVIVSDMRMPGMSGIELLTEVKQAKPDTVRIMLTGNHDQETAVEAVNRGDVFKFLTKPCETNTLISVLEQSVRQFQLVTAERELLTRTVQGSVKVLLDALSIAKPEAFGRNERLLVKARELSVGLEGLDSWELNTAALLANLGCVAVPKTTLDKVVAGRDLTKAERTDYERHPELGAQLLSAVPRFEGVAQCVLYQHKNFDGSGFPEDSRRGAEIPLGARVLRLALALDDLQSRGWSEAAVMQEIRDHAGWFDPGLLARLVDTPRGDTAQTFLVTADKLDVGLMIEEDVQNNQGVLLICRGQAVTPAIVKHLRHFHILGTLTADSGQLLVAFMTAHPARPQLPEASTGPILILGDLNGAPALQEIFERAARESGYDFRSATLIDEDLLTELSHSSPSCCVVIHRGNSTLAIAQLRTAVAMLPEAPVLLLTTRHTAILEADSLEVGADDCVSMSGLTSSAFVRIVGRSLKRSARRRRLLEASPIPMLHTTVQGAPHWANNALFKLFGCANLDDVRMLGVELLIATFARALNRENAPSHFASQQVITKMGGGQCDLMMMVSCLNPLGPEQGVQVSFTDITELETKRRRLDLAERRAREVYDSSPVMMYTLSVDSMILEANNHWLKQMSYEREEVIGAQSTRFHGPDLPFNESSSLWLELVDGEDSGSAEIQLVTRDGRIIDGLAYANSVRSSVGELVAFRLSVLDLTNFKRAQAERDKMERELRLAQKLESVGQMAAGIAHEINTPAQFVSDNLAFLGTAFSDLAPVLAHLAAMDEPHVRRMLEHADSEFLREEIPLSIHQAQDGIRRIRKIVLALKEFAHPGGEDKAPADLNHVIENTATLARGEWKHVAELQLDLCAVMPTVVCNASAVAQVVLNMIVNAAHAIGDRLATSEQGVAIITVRTVVEGKCFAISITDTGCGMNEETKSRIFDPFFTTKEVGRGSGQGLAIARAIVIDQHAGTITVDSELGKGTTFTIRLPIAENSEVDCGGADVSSD